MESFPHQLRDRVIQALHRALQEGEELPDGFSVDVTPTNDPKFGDYQCNAAMALGKSLRCNPRELATRLLDKFDASSLCEPPQIAGPGFLNFRLLPEVISQQLLTQAADLRLGVAETKYPQTVVIDFSAPNVAKPMHVGHIRSTVIGDCLARIGRFLGHHIITDNHIGDWGTQFGMILYGWKNLLDKAALENDPIAELLRVYKEVNALTKTDDSILEACRQELVDLQQGNEENLAVWKKTVDVSLFGLRNIYDQLGVTFDHFLGESFYNNDLGPLVEDLLEKGIARESDGAICIFSDGSLKPEK
ncbi:MAG: arginine--tRNA ligase, partial [Verrucomicrobiota bacterium]